MKIALVRFPVLLIFLTALFTSKVFAVPITINVEGQYTFQLSDAPNAGPDTISLPAITNEKVRVSFTYDSAIPNFCATTTCPGTGGRGVFFNGLLSLSVNFESSGLSWNLGSSAPGNILNTNNQTFTNSSVLRDQIIVRGGNQITVGGIAGSQYNGIDASWLQVIFFDDSQSSVPGMLMGPNLPASGLIAFDYFNIGLEFLDDSGMRWKASMLINPIAAEVPEPATVTLFALAILLLISIRKNKALKIV